MLFNVLGSFITVTSLAAIHVLADSLPPIEIVGNKFFFSNNGTQFFIRGVAYQSDGSDSNDGSNLKPGQSYSDPLANFEACSRDIPYLKQLRTNVIRVYSVNPSEDHSKCMQALNDAGIYVIADLSEPKRSINRNSPKWDLDLYERYTSVVDEFQKYDNVLGFFAGNEVSNSINNTDASAFVKAAIRDTKAYIKAKGYRKIPVGYSANDDQAIRVDLIEYFACGTDEERMEFYGANMYAWCGDSTYEKSGYADRTKEVAKLGVPAFFSEYGCNIIRPRKFGDVSALFGKMSDFWSGGVVYMYFEEANKYGLVSVGSDNKVTTLPDFENYSAQIAKVTPTGVNSADYSPSITHPSCPTVDNTWKAASNLPHVPDSNVCACMSDSLSCVVSDGLDPKDYEQLFEYVCSKVSCAGIVNNATTGEYGSYSFCDDKDKLSYVLDVYYKAQGKAADACDFNGSANLVKPSSQSACSPVLSAIGTAGTGSFSGSITYSGSAHSRVPAGSASDGSGSSSSTSTGKASSDAGLSNNIRSFSSLYTVLAITLSISVGLGLAII
ncbi:HFR127Cp [Eremothecium sinecaudum]|uniref:1,3-beta-glucanosyltransferase n=1 Tax=Eremothecium sinecaudum TaxID=45286 RepID=A0A0X8HUX4_9SACH|nr:HFR127Cp [Eremothecium sinecaudum]AMD21982.1 HFR127Cp [Eremothecium sinecaudum]